MPIYEYQCESCGQRSEAIQRISDPPLTTCDECGGGLRKLLSAPSFQFKGSGWYVTDYARKGDGKGEGEGKEKAKGKGKEPAKDKAADGGKSPGDSGSTATSSSSDAGPGLTKSERILSRPDG